jgi:hypothetical protein
LKWALVGQSDLQHSYQPHSKLIRKPGLCVCFNRYYAP